MVDKNEDTGRIAAQLLAYLRETLEKADLSYSAAPVPLQGGYETAIYRFQLAGVPEALSHPLVLRLYPAFYGSGNARWESAIQNVMAGVGYPVPKAQLVCSDMAVLGGAFFIMDHIPGQPLLFAPPESVMVILGQSHAALHQLDPEAVVAALRPQGLEQYIYNLGMSPESIKSTAVKMPWLREALDWLLENRPPEPARRSICHGDFHPINIMVQDGQVSGVLDWSGFRLAAGTGVRGPCRAPIRGAGAVSPHGPGCRFRLARHQRLAHHPGLRAARAPGGSVHRDPKPAPL